MFEEMSETKERYEIFPTKALKLVASVEAALLKGARKYLRKHSYVEVIVPHIVSATGSCEIIDTLFEFPYFENTAYLTQTGQLFLEAVIPFLGGKVYTFGPSFRAESRVDSRHLVEFSLLELEFEGNFERMLTVIEEIFMSMVGEVTKIHGIKESEHITELNPPFKRYSYGESIDLLDLTWGMDITSVDEQKLLKRNNNQPFFITHFPKKLKYFNMRENDDNPEIVNSADFILPFGGESVGAAEREHNPNNLLRRLKESSMWINYVAKGGDRHSFDWYIKAYQTFPYKLHSGFGMGLNRLTKFVLKLDDIRQSTIYPVNREAVY